MLETFEILAPGGGSVPFADPRESSPLDWTYFQLNSHPEWNSFPYDDQFVNTADPVHNFNRAKAFWSQANGLYEIRATKTFAGKLVQLPLDQARTELGWVYLAPCDFASCPPNVDIIADSLSVNGAAGPPVTGDLRELTASYRASVDWEAQYGRGFAQAWDLSDPWQRAAEFGSVSGPVPPGTSTLSPLFCPEDGGSAFLLETATVEDGAGALHDIVFVADWAGAVHAFDVTQILFSGSSTPLVPLDSWRIDDVVFDALQPNIYDIDVDVDTTGELATLYLAFSRSDVVVTSFAVDTGFAASSDVLVIKTPGEAYSVEIRRRPEGDILLIGDGTGGFRFLSR
jgi:hypothetical protein